MTDVPALRQGLAILRTIAERKRPMAGAALASELNLPRSTTYHLLAELRAAEAVEHHEEDQKWALGPLLGLLGAAYHASKRPNENEPAARERPADPGTTGSTPS